MKKLFCLFLAICMLALVGCSEPSAPAAVQQEDDSTALDPRQLLGTWQAQVDLSEFLTTELSEYELLSMGMLVTDFVVTVSMEFREDGTYRVWVDKDTIDASFETLMESIHELVWQDVEMMYMDPETDKTLEEQLKENGVDPDKDVEEIRDQLLTEGYVSKLQSRIDREGKYELIENELFLSDSKDADVDKNYFDVIEMRSGILTFVDSFAEEDFEGFLLYPLEFHKNG